MLTAALMVLTAGFVAAMLLWGGGSSDDQSSALDPDELRQRFPAPIETGEMRHMAGISTRPGWVHDPLLIRKIDDLRVVEVRGKRMNPLPNGQFSFDDPLILFRRGNLDILAIHAASGRIDAPENQPTRAQLSGEPDQPVTLTWYQITPDADGRHARLNPTVQVELQSADLDFELGQIVSVDEIRIITDQTLFVGKGLNLTVNTLRNRIERLVVQKGRELRIRDQHASDAERESEPGDEPVASAPPRRTTPPTQAGAGAEAQPDASTPAQWYRARFHDNIRISGPTVLAENARELELFFSDLVGGSAPDAHRPDPRKVESQEGNGVSPGTVTTAPSPDKPLYAKILAPEGRMMAFEPQDNDLVVTWDGHLRIDPLDEGPARAVNASDVVANLWPVEVSLLEDGKIRRRVLGGGMSYSMEAGQLTLHGEPENPLRLLDPQVGLIEGVPESPEVRIELARDGSQARWLGAGRLQTAGTSDTIGAPGTMRINWSNQAHIESISTDPDARAQADEAGDTRIIRFDGDVRARHIDFRLDTDRLDIDIREGRPGVASVQSILAKGNTRLVTRDSPTQPGIQLSARTLDLRPAGRGDAAIPDQLQVLASGQAVAVLPDSRLEAEELRFGLARLSEAEDDGAAKPTVAGDIEPHQTPPSDPMAAFDQVWTQLDLPPTAESAPTNRDDPGPETDPAGGSSWKLVTLEARRNVKLDLEAGGTRVRGDQLRIDQSGEHNRVDVLGVANAQPARISQSYSELEGHHIRMVEGEDRVVVDGPGRIRLLQMPDAHAPGDSATVNAGNDEASTEPVAAAPSSPMLHEATWQRSMRYDDLSGRVELDGEVRYQAGSRDRTHAMRGDRVLVQLSPRAQAAEPGDTRPGGSASPTATAEDATAVVRFNPQSLARTDGRQVLRIEAHSRLEDQPDAGFSFELFRPAEGDRVEPVVERSLEPIKPEGELLRRFNLRGTSIQLDTRTELLNVEGRGSMLYQDLETPDQAEERSAADTARDRAPGTELNITGSGDTLWTWRGGLRADFRANDLMVRRDVVMSHRPSGDGEVMHLYAHTVHADFEKKADSGSESGQSASAAPPARELPRLMLVRAEGQDGASRVRLTWPSREIWADRMIYNAISRQVELSSEPTRYVQVVPRDDPTMLTARRVRWDMDRDRLELIEPGPTTVAPRGGQGQR
ncbi:MAG: hypothetical protein JJU36_02935 [Phycisphaeraceae bacterium]|nr:hypothetical protein [Phycisphaeraceae bacterium]